MERVKYRNDLYLSQVLSGPLQLNCLSKAPWVPCEIYAVVVKLVDTLS